MNFSGLPASILVDPVLGVAVLVRMAAAVAAGCLPVANLIDLRVRAALAIGLAAAALPAAAVRAASVGPPGLLAEALIGLGLGLAAATAFAAATWAGGILGSVSGLSWADDAAAAGEGGAARLATWLALGGFLAAGGHLAVIGGLVDSFRGLPVGLPSGGGLDRIADVMTTVPTAALSLAIELASPALAAVLTYHVAVALCVRCVRFAPGPGLVQAGGSLALLTAVVAGAAGWTGGFATAVRPLLERCLDVSAP